MPDHESDRHTLKVQCPSEAVFQIAPIVGLARHLAIGKDHEGRGSCLDLSGVQDSPLLSLDRWRPMPVDDLFEEPIEISCPDLQVTSLQNLADRWEDLLNPAACQRRDVDSSGLGQGFVEPQP